jgi:RND superfamily putative drug exporter
MQARDGWAHAVDACVQNPQRQRNRLSPKPMNRARLCSRLGEINDWFDQLAMGASQLQAGLTEGAAKLRAILWLKETTGLRLIDSLASSQVGTSSTARERSEPNPSSQSSCARKRPAVALLRELPRAAEGVKQIARGARRAHHEVTSILTDPAGRRALYSLLITPQTVQNNPELKRSFAAYIAPDCRHARIDLTQADRLFSSVEVDEVFTLRTRLQDYLGENSSIPVTAQIGGPNVESADVRAMTRTDQLQSWFMVPIGVFLVLLVALRDPLACLNLVATMILTYAFALGATHLVFVTLLGAEGLDWKVPYFLFVLLVAVGVDYNVFLMTRLQEEAKRLGLRCGIVRAVAQTGGLISAAAAITACSFASFLISPVGSLRQLGFALVVGILADALLVRPLLVPAGHWLLWRGRERLVPRQVLRRGAIHRPIFGTAAAKVVLGECREIAGYPHSSG